VICTLANINRGKGKPAQKPAEFHPFLKKKAPRQATPEEIQALFGPDWHKVKT
jgi:hypothetical protein